MSLKNIKFAHKCFFIYPFNVFVSECMMMLYHFSFTLFQIVEHKNTFAPEQKRFFRFRIFFFFVFVITQTISYYFDSRQMILVSVFWCERTFRSTSNRRSKVSFLGVGRWLRWGAIRHTGLGSSSLPHESKFHTIKVSFIMIFLFFFCCIIFFSCLFIGRTKNKVKTISKTKNLSAFVRFELNI